MNALLYFSICRAVHYAITPAADDLFLGEELTGAAQNCSESAVAIPSSVRSSFTSLAHMPGQSVQENADYHGCRVLRQLLSAMGQGSMWVRPCSGV